MLMKLSLAVNEGVHKGKVIPIALSQFLIGRDSQCHLRPSSPMISKRHCALLVKGGKVLVRDFDSTNGTFVNEERVKGERQLNNGDQLKLGPLAFLVQIEAAAPVEKARPAPKKKGRESVEDESAAALLLELGAGEELGAPVPVDSEGIPTGSTILDMPAPDQLEAKPGTGKTPPPKPASADTSDAAKAILDKYSRRRRT
jgi:pSer/pThr/pTyr-binding forkhead associated (FHA) protein